MTFCAVKNQWQTAGAANSASRSGGVQLGGDSVARDGARGRDVVQHHEVVDQARLPAPLDLDVGVAQANNSREP
jgi:hypothetical protein